MCDCQTSPRVILEAEIKYAAERLRDRACVCAGVVEGSARSVEAYLRAGGDPARALTAGEVALLNRASAFDAGHTLVHLAIRFQRQDILAALLASISGQPPSIKRSPSYVGRSHILYLLLGRSLDSPKTRSAGEIDRRAGTRRRAPNERDLTESVVHLSLHDENRPIVYVTAQ